MCNVICVFIIVFVFVELFMCVCVCVCVCDVYFVDIADRIECVCMCSHVYVFTGVPGKLLLKHDKSFLSRQSTAYTRISYVDT